MLSHIKTPCKRQGYVPFKWNLIPFLETYRVLNIDMYHEKGSPNQCICHFHLLIGNAMSNDALMSRLFVGSLKGTAFDWFYTLPVRSIKWADLEAWLLTCFCKNDTKISMPTLIEEKQKKSEPVKNFVKKLRNLSRKCPEAYCFPCYYKFVGIIFMQILKIIWVQSMLIYGKSYKTG